MNKKGSVYLTLIIIALVIGAYFIVNMSKDMDLEQEQRAQIETGMSYEDLLGLYSIDSGVYSSLFSTFDSADSCLGWGESPNNCYWISYGIPNAPDLETVKDSLEEPAKQYINQFLTNLMGSQYGNIEYIELPQIEEIEILVDEDKLGQGEYDQGFDIYAKPSGTAKINYLNPESGESQEINVEQLEEFTATVTDWRFFYMYRKIKAWVDQQDLSQKTCNEMPAVQVTGSGPGCNAPFLNEDEILSKVEESVLELETSLNMKYEGEDFECDFELPCKYVNLDLDMERIDCTGTKECDDGTESAQECRYGRCTYVNFKADACTSGDCEDEYCPRGSGFQGGDQLPVPPCKSGSLDFNGVPIQQSSDAGGSQIGDGPDSCFGVGTQEDVSYIAEITCKDNKYEHMRPGYDEKQNLEMTFSTHVYLGANAEKPPVTCKAPGCTGGSSNDGEGPPSGSGGEFG
ncbi:hypothetical protein GF327_08665 [Candidatus Woesearchaeota archaeon]|nr:hypothetical protein [Candidatus Woesearchaeota archaeon]